MDDLVSIAARVTAVEKAIEDKAKAEFHALIGAVRGEIAALHNKFEYMHAKLDVKVDEAHTKLDTMADAVVERLHSKKGAAVLLLVGIVIGVALTLVVQHYMGS